MENQVHRKKSIIIVIIAFILGFIGWLTYITFNDSGNSRIIFPPKIDNDLKFFSEEVCQRLETKGDFEIWKLKLSQLQNFDQRYQSEFLGKAAQLISQLKKMQEISTVSQGDAQSFAYYEKQLNECSQKIKIDKKDLEDEKKQAEQELEEKGNELKNKNQTFHKNKDELKSVVNRIQSTSYELKILLSELQLQIDQKERLRRSYKNETELALHHVLLNDQINKSRLAIAEQELSISLLSKQVTAKQNQFTKIATSCTSMQSQLSDAKSLEQYFHSDNFYVKEDIPIIEVFQQYNKGLEDRLNNLNILAKREKDPEQKAKNERARLENQKMQQVSEGMYQTVKAFQQDCEVGTCFFGTPFDKLTLNGLRGEIVQKQEKYFSMLSEKSTIELELNTLKESLDFEIQRNQQERSKLNKLIEEQNALDKDKDRHKELAKIQEKINELEKKKQELLITIDQAQKREQDLKNVVENEAITLESLEKQATKLAQEQVELYKEKLDKIRKNVKDCIKSKKVHDYYKSNQVNLIKKVNEIKAQIPEIVESLTQMLTEYSSSYELLRLRQCQKRLKKEAESIQPLNLINESQNNTDL